MILAITTTNTIIGVLIIFSGIALLRYFAQRKGETNSYKPAIFIYVIWFIISFSLIKIPFYSNFTLMNVLPISLKRFIFKYFLSE